MSRTTSKLPPARRASGQVQPSPSTFAWSSRGTPPSPSPRGELNAQDAFVNGHIRLFGDQQRLLASQPVFRALDAVFTDVRSRTEYR